MKMPKQENRMTKTIKEIVIIMILIFGLFAGAYVIAGWMGDDLEAKNLSLSEPNEPHDAMTICDKCPHFGWSNEPEPNKPKFILDHTVAENTDPNEPDDIGELRIDCDCGKSYTVKGNLFSPVRCTILTAIDPNEPIDTQIAERDYRAMKETETYDNLWKIDMEETKLISLEDWDSQQREVYQNINQPSKNGIACPECGKELFDTNNGIAYPTYPMQYPIHCKCGWMGTRI